MKIATKACLSASLIAVAIGSALAACVEHYSFPLPCQGTSAIRCPSDCTTVYDPDFTNRANCVGVTDGCCQWVESRFKCTGGSCGTKCLFVQGPHLFTVYRAFWVCCPNGPSDHVCKASCP